MAEQSVDVVIVRNHEEELLKRDQLELQIAEIKEQKRREREVKEAEKKSTIDLS